MPTSANHGGGWHADIPALRERHPRLMTFATWLEHEGAQKFAAAQQRVQLELRLA